MLSNCPRCLNFEIFICNWRVIVIAVVLDGDLLLWQCLSLSLSLSLSFTPPHPSFPTVMLIMCDKSSVIFCLIASECVWCNFFHTDQPLLVGWQCLLNLGTPPLCHYVEIGSIPLYYRGYSIMSLLWGKIESKRKYMEQPPS